MSQVALVSPPAPIVVPSGCLTPNNEALAIWCSSQISSMISSGFMIGDALDTQARYDELVAKIEDVRVAVLPLSNLTTVVTHLAKLSNISTTLTSLYGQAGVLNANVSTMTGWIEYQKVAVESISASLAELLSVYKAVTAGDVPPVEGWSFDGVLDWILSAFSVYKTILSVTSAYGVLFTAWELAGRVLADKPALPEKPSSTLPALPDVKLPLPVKIVLGVARTIASALLSELLERLWSRFLDAVYPEPEKEKTEIERLIDALQSVIDGFSVRIEHNTESCIFEAGVVGVVVEE